MSSAGSKVLHPRSVELAMKYGNKIMLEVLFQKNGPWLLKKKKN